VDIPFADRLAELVPPLAVRLRRDFKTVLMLVRAHAVLHQASQRKDDEGRVIAEIEDYRVVRELIADLVAVGVEASVSRRYVRLCWRYAACLKRDGSSSSSQTSSPLTGHLTSLTVHKSRHTFQRTTTGGINVA